MRRPAITSVPIQARRFISDSARVWCKRGAFRSAFSHPHFHRCRAHNVREALVARASVSRNNERTAAEMADKGRGIRDALVGTYARTNSTIARSPRRGACSGPRSPVGRPVFVPLPCPSFQGDAARPRVLPTVWARRTGIGLSSVWLLDRHPRDIRSGEPAAWNRECPHDARPPHAPRHVRSPQLDQPRASATTALPPSQPAHLIPTRP